jgi:hypothetical protein
MSVVIDVDFQTPQGGGTKMIAGTGNIGVYLTGGAPMNLSNYLLSTGSPIVTATPTDGYILKHDFGTAAAGKLKVYQQVLNAKNGIDQNIPMIEVTNATDLSAVKFGFIAMGQPY